MGLFFFSVLKAGRKYVFAAVKQLWQKVMGSTVTARRDSKLLHLPALISVQEECACVIASNVASAGDKCALSSSLPLI